MNISSSTSLASLYNTSAISSRVAEAYAKPQERLSQQAESTRVQLSAFGEIKSATSQLETAANQLRDNKQLNTLDGLNKAVQGFAEAVNNRLTTVNRLGAVESGALAGDGKVRAANNETRRTLEGVSGNNRDALQQIGIAVTSNGGLKVDAQKLASAFNANPDRVRETLNMVGQQVAEQSARQLGNNGTVGGTIGKLTEQLGNIEQRQSDVRGQFQQMQQAVQERDVQFARVQQMAQTGFVFTGAAAYNRIFSS